jgi:hypothetical protein
MATSHTFICPWFFFHRVDTKASVFSVPKSTFSVEQGLRFHGKLAGVKSYDSAFLCEGVTEQKKMDSSLLAEYWGFGVYSMKITGSALNVFKEGKCGELSPFSSTCLGVRFRSNSDLRGYTVWQS